jgi:hypothetical protein
MVHSRHRRDDDRDRAGRTLVEVTLDGVVHRFRTEGDLPPLMISVAEITPCAAFDQLWHEFGEESDRDYQPPSEPPPRRSPEEFRQGDAVTVDAEFCRHTRHGLSTVVVSPHFYLDVQSITVKRAK